MNIIFLCYEITKGMKSFGPKALIPMGKKRNSNPLIVKQIKEIQKIYENTEHKIHVVLGFEHERVTKALKDCKTINTIIYERYHETNSAGAIVEVLKRIGKEDCLFIENGIIAKYKPKHLDQSCIPAINSNDHEAFPIGITHSQDKAEYLFYDLEPKWPEVAMMHKSDFDHIMRVSETNQVSQMFFFEYLNLLIESGINFHTEPVSAKKFNKILNHKIITI
jgi:hypothetical protein